MLQTIRDHTQGWIAGVIISIIILTFALWGIHSYFEGGGNNNIVAVVNDNEITKEQLAVSYERLHKQIQYQYGANIPASLTDAQIKDRALRSLIETEALKDSAVDQGFRVTDRQVDNFLQTMPEFQVNGGFSLERFQTILASVYLSISDFLNIIRANLLIDQPKFGIAFSSFALPNETRGSMSLVNQEREFDYLVIPLQNFLAKQGNITQEKIQSYYDSHQKEFTQPEQVSVDYIELNLNSLAAKIMPTDVMLKNFYQENPGLFTAPQSFKVQDVFIPAPATLSQADADKLVVQAESTVKALKSGSELNNGNAKQSSLFKPNTWIPLNEFSEEVRKEIATAKPNDVLGPIKTPEGLQVIKVVEIRNPEVLSFEVSKARAKELYIRQHAEEKFAELRERLADLTYEHPDSLQFASETLNLPIQTSEVFNLEKVGKDISQHKKVRTAAFANDVLNLQNNSDVISVTPETFVVLRIKTHKPATMMQLPSVAAQITQRIQLKQAENEVQSLAENIVTNLKNGKDINAVVKSNQLNWNQSTFLGRYANKVDSALLDTAFRLPDPALLKRTSYGIAKVPQGYAVVAVKSVRVGASDSKEYNVFAEQIQNSDGVIEYELYKSVQLNNAKIKVMA
ncbi:MAG: SurA N-terminal domain-containing protein [Gammaproteobacteria bacterium]|nr:SurA N-terminal domain-containing protein [Gammaproteobacteria bacterium]